MVKVKLDGSRYCKVGGYNESEREAGRYSEGDDENETSGAC